MERKMTTEKAVGLYSILTGITMNKLAGRTKVALVRVLLALKPTADQWNTALEEARKRLTEGKDLELELAKRASEKDTALTDEERTRMEAFGKEFEQGMEEALKDIRTEEVTVKFTPLDEDAMADILSVTDWNPALMMEVQGELAAEE